MSNATSACGSARGSLTIITALVPKSLGKRYSLTSQGLLHKEVAGALVAGTYEVRDFGDLSQLAQLLVKTDHNQALTVSLPRDGSLSGSLVTKAAARSSPGALTRTKADFAQPVGRRGVLILDHDPRPGAPIPVETLWEMLGSACPAVLGAGVLQWSSGSSWIYSDGELLRGASGLRFYVLVEDLSDLPRAGAVLAKRLWLENHGYVHVCRRRSNIDPPCRSNIDPGMEADRVVVGCGQV